MNGPDLKGNGPEMRSPNEDTRRKRSFVLYLNEWWRSKFIYKKGEP